MYFTKLITMTIASMAIVAIAHPDGINSKPKQLATRGAAHEANPSNVHGPKSSRRSQPKSTCPTHECQGGILACEDPLGTCPKNYPPPPGPPPDRPLPAIPDPKNPTPAPSENSAQSSTVEPPSHAPSSAPHSSAPKRPNNAPKSPKAFKLVRSKTY